MTHDETPKTKAESALPIGRFGQFLLDKGVASKRLPDSCGVETLELEADNLLKATESLSESPEVALDLLLTVSGVDSPDTFDSVYHLWSYTNNNELVLKVRVPKSSVKEGDLPIVPSLTPRWEAANWHERETYDLVGFRYIGHPYLRRILNPWDWEGYPLRRDYKQLIDALNDKSPGSFR